ncbi:kinase-like domain-containing protein [Aspergillus californicus]
MSSQKRSQPPQQQDPACSDNPELLPGDGLYLSFSFDIEREGLLEQVDMYHPGGHHPVHLDNLLGDEGQYRVIHKLGSGGFGNLWLCRVGELEPSEYVAVKILVSEFSKEDSREIQNSRRIQELAKMDPDVEKYFLVPLDDFRIDGPNGIHQAIVYPVAGPPVEKIEKAVKNPHDTLYNMVCDTAAAMATLHRHGICHGDFRPKNILLRYEGLNGMEEEDVLEYFGEVGTIPVLVMEGYPDPGLHAPEYLVLPAWPEEETLTTERICVIDFGEAFDNTSPPAHGTGIPEPYRAPESVLEEKCGFASDIWALAATLYEIRKGRPLFRPILCEEGGGYLATLVRLFGPMPEAWWSTAWKTRKEFFADELDAKGRAIWLKESSCRAMTDLGEELRQHDGHALRVPGGGYQDIWDCTMPDVERDLFEDLLRTMFTYDPAKRLTIEQVLQHPYFSFGATTPDVKSDFTGDHVVEHIEVEHIEVEHIEVEHIEVEHIEVEEPRATWTTAQEPVAEDPDVQMPDSAVEITGFAHFPAPYSRFEVVCNRVGFSFAALSLWLRTTIYRFFSWVTGNHAHNS